MGDDIDVSSKIFFCNSQLLDTAAVGVRREKLYKLDEHIACAVAGLTGACPPHFSRVSKCVLWCLDHLKAVHWCCGRAADANIIINTARLSAQRYLFAYGEPIPVEQLVRAVCDSKQVHAVLQFVSSNQA